jgi:hypothetical protein
MSVAGHSAAEEPERNFIVGFLVFGLLGGLAGLPAGAAMGADQVYPVTIGVGAAPPQLSEQVPE